MTFGCIETSMERRKMVRVISCHNFQAQDVFTVDSEPVALCAARNLLLVATLDHCVEVWDLLNPGKLLHSFPTVDQAKQMVFCPIGDYVCTLEVRSSRQAVMSFVRMYLNWQVDMKGQPMRARIAGRVTPSSQSGAGLLEMIELPLKRQAFCIASCCQTGNLAVGLGELVSIYRFCVKTHDLSRRSFCDLEPLLDVTFDQLMPSHLALNEDVLACLSPNELHVIKIKVQPDMFGETSSSSFTAQSEETSAAEDEGVSAPAFQSAVEFDEDNFVVPDENFIVWDFDNIPVSENAATEHLRGRIHADSWPIIINLPGLAQQQQQPVTTPEKREVLGPSGLFPVKSELHENPGQMVTTLTLLYRYFILDQEISSGLHSLHLMPIYEAEGDKDGSSPKSGLLESSNLLSSPFESDRFKARCGLTCFFSSPKHGYLYNLVDSVHLVVTYPYTSAARAVALDNYVLHAVTEAGLETYTLRNVHCALRHLENKRDNILLPKRSSEDPVCLVGLKAFLNVEQMVLAQKRLVLLSAITDESSSSQDSDSNSWTVYSLTNATPEEFYRDMLEAADSHREKSPSTYIHLLREAYCVLQGEMLQKADDGELSPETHDLFRESCCLMGDFFLVSDNSEENRMAVSYYQASRSPIPDVVSRVLHLWSQAHPMPLPVKGLMDYLNHHLLEVLEVGKPIPVSKSMGDIILDLYADNEPNKLAIVLTKGRLGEFSTEKAVSLLKKRILSKKAFPEDIVTLSWLYLQPGHSEQVMSLLSTLPKDRLLDVLIQQYQLWTRSGHFSPLSKAIRQWRPDIFVEVTLQLVFNERLSADESVALFEKASPHVEFHKIAHLKEYLEALLTSNCAKVWSTDAPRLLSRVYLNRMKSDPLERQSQSFVKALNLFGSRPSWLNMLPPFEGRSLRDPCLVKQQTSGATGSNPTTMPTSSAAASNAAGAVSSAGDFPLSDQSNLNQISSANSNLVTCPCWECNEDLIRLQSLMRHDSCPQNVAQFVLEHVIEHPNLKGELSLRILSSNPTEVIFLLVDVHPLALVHYGKDSFGDNLEQWRLVRDELVKRIKDKTLTAPTTPTTKQMSPEYAMQMLLSHLAEILQPKSFLDILPQGDSETYLPYVKRCCNKYQASLLKETIIAKGLELKGMV